MLTDRERHALRMLEFHTRVEDPRFARRLEQPTSSLRARVRRLLPYFLLCVLVTAIAIAVGSPSAVLGTVAFVVSIVSAGVLAVCLWTGRRERRARRLWRDE